MQKKLPNEVLIEDIIQETFLAALKSVNSFTGESSERTWLTSILNHKIIDEYRVWNTRKGKFNKQMILQSELEQEYHMEISKNHGPVYQTEMNVNFQEFQNFVYGAKHLLSKRKKEVFELKIINEYDHEVVCEKLGITKSYLWVVVHKIRKKINGHLVQEWYQNN